MIPILILAGGGSTRMGGRDKLMEDVGGQPLLRQHARQALALGGPVFVALPAADHPRAAALAGLDVQVLAVADAAEGMSGTMRGAVAMLPKCEAFMMVLADLVAIDASDLRRIDQARTDNPDFVIWRGATADGKSGHPIIFDASLRPEFAKLHGDGGGEALVNPRKAQTHLTPLKGRRARLDLDTPQDWDDWRAGRLT
ncbi:nucleotidyltransferase family protein [Yoonia sp. SS1-5]|uniref:Nucleotidyltransferase family protein n=1 Tax=Yoonia rhodophyticola TaxID=3137370 RepID=A0AAN0M7S9_9RHOB